MITALIASAIVCTAPTHFGNQLRLTLSGGDAHVVVTRPDGGIELERNFAGVSDVWDGHMTGLITAPGLSVKYENHYGCIRNVKITTNTRGGTAAGFIEELSTPGCTGGTTPDDICFRD